MIDQWSKACESIDQAEPYHFYQQQLKEGIQDWEAVAHWLDVPLSEAFPVEGGPALPTGPDWWAAALYGRMRGDASWMAAVETLGLESLRNIDPDISAEQFADWSAGEETPPALWSAWFESTQANQVTRLVEALRSGD